MFSSYGFVIADHKTSNNNTNNSNYEKKISIASRIARRRIGPNSTWLVSTRLDATRHIRLCRASRASRDERVELVEPCCSNMADDEEAVVLACTSFTVCALCVRIDIELFEELFNHARFHILLFIISDHKLN